MLQGRDAEPQSDSPDKIIGPDRAARHRSLARLLAERRR